MNKPYKCHNDLFNPEALILLIPLKLPPNSPSGGLTEWSEPLAVQQMCGSFLWEVQVLWGCCKMFFMHRRMMISEPQTQNSNI